jgi:hypothetical protein
MNKRPESDSRRSSIIKRNQIQLTLMQEVNQKQPKYTQEDLEEVSTSGSDPTFTYDSIGDEQDASAHRTRAQKVHSTNTFQGISSAQATSVSMMGRLSNI